MVEQRNSEPRKTSPWVYVAIGCGVAVVLAGIAVVVLGVFSYHKLKDFEAELKDPEARAAKVAEVLGAEELPTGYEPALALSIPFFMDMAILSDRPFPEGEEPGHRGEMWEERGFLYFKMLSSARQRRELDDFFEGRIDDTDFLRQSSINLQRGEVIARGELTAGEASMRWVAQRGSVATGRGRSREDGLTTTVLIECPSDDRLRLGMWFGPGPPESLEATGEGARGEGAGGLDFTGTVADEAALTDFLGYFRFCG